MSAHRFWLAIAIGMMLIGLSWSWGVQASPEQQGPAQAGTELLLVPVGETDPFLSPVLSSLLESFEVLDVVEMGGQYHLLVRASVQDRQRLSAQGFEAQLLAAERPGLRFFWVYPLPGRPAPADLSPLVMEEQRVLVHMEPARAVALSSGGLYIRELQRMNPPRADGARREHPLLEKGVPDSLNLLISAMMSRVDTATLAGYVADLSGERPIAGDGTATRIWTRYSGTDGMFDAAEYLRRHYQRLDLQVELWPYGTRGWVNVVATQPGLVHPEQVYILCAHYDNTSESPFTLAPGADDNASGTAAVMAAAAILSQYAFDYTIRYVHFSGEEQGLYGSYAYAHQSANLDEHILGVINLDMIAWNRADGPVLGLHARQSPSEELARVFQEIVRSYGLDLQLDILRGAEATDRSDHAAFWAEGYAALLGIEDFLDFNAGYHSTSDRLEHFDLNYFTDVAKAAVGTLATLAGPLIELPITPVPTATPTPWPTPACPNHLTNGDFEAGPPGLPWESRSAGGYALIHSRNPHNGRWSAWLNQSDWANDSLCQHVTLPAEAQDIALEFWWHMQTDETSYVHSYDWLELRIQPAGALTSTVLARIDDGHLQHLWLPARVSLQAYAGHTVNLCFVSHSDSWKSTYFFIDDVQLTYCSYISPTPTATAPRTPFWLPLLLK